MSRSSASAEFTPSILGTNYLQSSQTEYKPLAGFMDYRSVIYCETQHLSIWVWILAPCCTYTHLKLKQGGPYDLANSEILFCFTSVTQHLPSTRRCDPNSNFYGSHKPSINIFQLPQRPLEMLQGTAEQLQTHLRQDQYKSFYVVSLHNASYRLFDSMKTITKKNKPKKTEE